MLQLKNITKVYKSVVLPHPLWPSIDTNSDSLNFKLIPFKASTFSSPVIYVRT